jgi:hypothetical protein
VIDVFGTLLETKVHEYGGTPPAAVKVNVYGCPIVASGSSSGAVIANGCAGGTGEEGLFPHPAIATAKNNTAKNFIVFLRTIRENNSTETSL